MIKFTIEAFCGPANSRAFLLLPPKCIFTTTTTTTIIIIIIMTKIYQAPLTWGSAAPLQYNVQRLLKFRLMVIFFFR